MDLKGHMKRHSAINIERRAVRETDNSSPTGDLEHKRGSQHIQCPQAEKKPRLETYDRVTSANGRIDDSQFLERQPSGQQSNALAQLHTGGDPRECWASELPHARERCEGLRL